MTTIKFHEISIADYDLYHKLEQQDYMTICDHIFGSVLFWSGAYRTELAFLEGCAVLRYQMDGQAWFSFPVGGTEAQKVLCLKELLEHCKNVEHQPLRFYIVSDAHRNLLLKHFPYRFAIDSNRDRFDYVYEVERLSSLKGKRLAAKRNHIHRFEEKGEWCYEDITTENIEECWAMEEEWLSIQEVNEEEREELEAERKAIRMAMDHFETLHLMGGLIRLNGKIVAFTIGERLNNETLVLHFEKAYFNIQGSYQIINQQFLLHHKDEFRYVNREDDTGDPGLRKSKLSYHPDILEKKYTVIESDIVYARKEDSAEIIDLWEEAFGDSEEYIRFYLENRFTEENMLVIREDDKIVSMASFWDASIKENDQIIPVKYVYAVATSISSRGKGYASRLMRHAYEKYQMPLILQPGSSSLFHYYANIGFQKCFLECRRTWNATDTCNSDCIIHSHPTEELIKRYFDARELHMADVSYVQWNLPAITYALLENSYCGGHIAELSDGFILYRIRKDFLDIVEIVLPKERIDSGILSLLCCLNKTKASINNPGGMLLWPESDEITIHSPYLGLTLA